jgi:hypothetical protein
LDEEGLSVFEVEVEETCHCYAHVDCALEGANRGNGSEEGRGREGKEEGRDA